MNDESEIDLSLMTYDEWVAFVFDHPVSDSREPGKEWYWGYGYELSHPSQPSRLVEHFTLLCDHFVDVAKRYSLPQIDLGIWFILGACIDFGEYLRDRQISITTRRSCIQSMYRVFADFVAKSDVEEMENCFFMWWDLLLGSFYSCGETVLDEDAKEIENSMLDTLTRILRLKDLRTQHYALHGLGHLKHPGAREAVARYMKTHGGEWTEEGKQCLQQCRDGTVM